MISCLSEQQDVAHSQFGHSARTHVGLIGLFRMCMDCIQQGASQIFIAQHVLTFYTQVPTHFNEC